MYIAPSRGQSLNAALGQKADIIYLRSRSVRSKSSGVGDDLRAVALTP
jgi:hypothetical protein